MQIHFWSSHLRAFLATYLDLVLSPTFISFLYQNTTEEHLLEIWIYRPCLFIFVWFVLQRSGGPCNCLVWVSVRISVSVCRCQFIFRCCPIVFMFTIYLPLHIQSHVIIHYWRHIFTISILSKSAAISRPQHRRFRLTKYSLPHARDLFSNCFH